jgi:hypothetical protein
MTSSTEAAMTTTVKVSVVIAAPAAWLAPLELSPRSRAGANEHHAQ